MAVPVLKMTRMQSKTAETGGWSMQGQKDEVAPIENSAAVNSPSSKEEVMFRLRYEIWRHETKLKSKIHAHAFITEEHDAHARHWAIFDGERLNILSPERPIPSGFQH
jgi:hypothetical protein